MLRAGTQNRLAAIDTLRLRARLRIVPIFAVHLHRSAPERTIHRERVLLNVTGNYRAPINSLCTLCRFRIRVGYVGCPHNRASGRLAHPDREGRGRAKLIGLPAASFRRVGRWRRAAIARCLTRLVLTNLATIERYALKIAESAAFFGDTASRKRLVRAAHLPRLATNPTGFCSIAEHAIVTAQTILKTGLILAAADDATIAVRIRCAAPVALWGIRALGPINKSASHANPVALHGSHAR